MYKVKNKIKDDQWFLPFLKKRGSKLFLIFLLAFLTVFCASALMFTSGYLISRSARHPENLFVVYVPVVLTRAFGIGRPVFKYLQSLQSHDWVLSIASSLRDKLYFQLEGTGSFLAQIFKTGDLLELLSDDIDHLENFYLRVIFPVLQAYLVYVFVLFLSLILDWRLFLGILLSLLASLLLVPVLLISKVWINYLKKKDLTGKSYQIMTDAVLGIEDWKISGRIKDFIGLTRKEDHEISRLDHQKDGLNLNKSFLVQVCFAAAVLFTLFWAGKNLTYSNSAANYAAAIVLTLFPIFDCFAPVVSAFDELPFYLFSLDQLNDFSKKNNKAVLKNKNNFIDISSNEVIKEINIKNAAFSYSADDDPLLKDFSLDIEPEEKISVLGPSGEGKTTLLQLIIGELQLQKGKILYNGRQKISDDQIKKSFSYLNQDPFIFNSSILNNVRLADEKASRKQVIDILKEVGLWDFVKKLPNDIDYQVSEKGNQLSGGQKQRLALARILLKDSPILLLDEPTSGLDPITERHLIDTILETQKHKTMIWVTHRLVGLEKMDKIIFLDKGKAVMEGRPFDLYQKYPRFAHLYDLDAGRVD